MRWLALIPFLGLSACAMLERSARSGYYETYEGDGGRAADIYEMKRQNVQSEAREELGMQGRPLNDGESEAVETRVRLKRMETKLASKRDKKQYYNVRGALKNDRERLYFLSLPTYEARERWAASRGLGAQDEVRSEEMAKVIEGNDIALGMSQKGVLESWGDPDAIEAAGNPLYGYERWKYNRYVSGNEGYQKEMRIVYFEGGRVVGWERP
ncbi:MAG: hypothetical protein KF799_07700 [Bdellovibrionales bacterium]|nr:hypothetical protein [Bdellovibrionales bacterium]